MVEIIPYVASMITIGSLYAIAIIARVEYLTLVCRDGGK